METTEDQRRAVARDQCRMSGHRISSVSAAESLAPMLVVCTRCDSTWRIHPNDQGQDFGAMGR